MTNATKRLAALVLAVILLAGAAPAPTPTRSGASDAPADAARKALDQVMAVEFAETSLPGALAQLGELAKVHIVLDRSSIQQLGMDPNEMPVTARLKDVRLRAGLRTVLAQYNLGYAAVGDTIIVTTEDVAQQRLLRQSVDVDVAGQPLADELKRLARVTGVNLVIDPRQVKVAQATVTLRLDDVPLETAVRLLSELGGLKPVRMGTVVFVTSEERADKLKADGDLMPATPPALVGDRTVAIPAPPVVGGGVFPPPVALPAPPAVPPRNAP
jgi:hypothetical protein